VDESRKIMRAGPAKCAEEDGAPMVQKRQTASDTDDQQGDTDLPWSGDVVGRGRSHLPNFSRSTDNILGNPVELRDIIAHLRSEP